MPRNGSGVYQPPAANYPAVSGTTITAANRNGVDADIATALTNSLAVNGESVVTANIPMSGNKLTGLGAATARTDAASIATIQDGTGVYSGTVGGTADVITITPSPAITAYAAGQLFSFIASGANTTNVTINVNGLGAKAVTKNGTTALAAGDIPSGFVVTIRYDGTRFQLVGAKDAFTGGTVANATTFGSSLTVTGATDLNGALTIDGGATATTDITMSAATVKLAKGADVASATALPLITDGNYFDVTGTTTITSMNTMGVGTQITLHFDGALTLTHHSTDLVLPSGANITTAAGDEATFIEYASGDWRCVNYQKADGTPVVAPVPTQNMVRLHTANGYGSTNTVIRRFTTTVTNTGSAITYADSATLGATFTINTDGVYAISYSDSFNTPAVLGLSLNSSQLTTSIGSITAADILIIGLGTNTTSSADSVSWTGYLASGSVIRAHTAGNATGGIIGMFTIVKTS